MTPERREFDKKPQWFIDEMDELRRHIDLKANSETVNHIKEVQSSIIKYGIAAICAGTVAIGGLYVLYYSGLAELKTDVKVISNELTDVKSDVTDIKKVLFSADITQ